MKKVALIVGSLRKESLTRKVANALVMLAPKSLECSIVEIGDLPLYNEDLDAQAPAAWQRFRSEIKGRQAVLFLTPEYNRSVPGCLKNALDVGSRPAQKSVFNGLPAGVVSVTPYKLGAFGANHALRQTFAFLNMPVMQQPEAYIGDAGDLFDATGALKNTATRTFLGEFMTAFASWIDIIGGSPEREDFSVFLKQRARAASAYVCGDAAPLDAIVPAAGAASFFPPAGGSVRGAREVAERYDRDAKAFSPGGSSTFEIVQSGAAGDLGFWTGFQDADVRMAGHDKTVHMKLRITELFRFEAGEWKLVHRHADSAAEAKSD